MTEARTRVERHIDRIKRNPLVVSLIFIGTVVIALAAFTDATTKLLGLVVREGRPPVNGTWTAEVVYDWPNAEYTETFAFSGDGEEVYGTASFLGTDRGILEGTARADEIRFITRTQEVLDDPNDARDVVHRYRGRISGDEIIFVMQTEGGYSSHVPIEFVAVRAPDRPRPQAD